MYYTIWQIFAEKTLQKLKKTKMNNRNIELINVILYCRVSTDEQAEKGFSLNYQEESLKRFCTGMGYNIIKIFREDHSAKNFNRPEWYYHCRGKCKTRVRKEKVETRVTDLLSTIQINANIKEAFIDVMRDIVMDSKGYKAVELTKKKARRKEILKHLENADDMRLSKELTAERYTSIVERYTSELRKLELEIKALEQNNENVNDYLETGLTLIENLDLLFNETDNEGKKMLIGSLFTDKLILGNECCQTTDMNGVINVLTRNSKDLESYKKGKAVKNDNLSFKVPGAGVEPARFPTGV